MLDLLFVQTGIGWGLLVALWFLWWVLGVKLEERRLSDQSPVAASRATHHAPWRHHVTFSRLERSRND